MVGVRPGWWDRVPWRRRRLLRVGAALALLAGAGLLELRGEDSSTVIVVSRDLPGGHRLGDDDLTVRTLDPALSPDGAATDTDTVIGIRLTAPVRRGEILTDARLAGSGTGADSRRVVPVPLADPAVGALLAPGDVVDLVVSVDPDPGDPRLTGTGPADRGVVDRPGGGAGGNGSPPAPGPWARTIARAVEVVEVPPGRVAGSATVLISVPTDEAAQVAAIAGVTPVAILVHG